MTGPSEKPFGRRKAERKAFMHKPPVQIIALDGSWQRSCTMVDISESGTRLQVEGSLDGINLRKDFFLRLSSVGMALRKCQLVRINGAEIGIRFVEK